MSKRTRLIISTSVLVVMIGAIFFAGKPELSSAQTEGFEIYQLSVHCGDSQLPSAIFGHRVTEGGTVGRPLMGTWSICAGNCPGGAVSYADALAGLPAAVSAALQAKVDKHQADAAAGKGWRLNCLGDDKKPPEKKCEKPTPWFDGSSNCKDVQSPDFRVNEYDSLIELSMCGYSVFVHIVPKDYPGGLVGYKTQLENFVRRRVGSRICCDKLREAARTGVPCNPTRDIDCDGKSNQADFYTLSYASTTIPSATFPDINRPFTSPEGAPIDPFPEGLNPDDPDFLPPQDKCDCKWELNKGTLNCSPDGKQNHFYQARWRCPSTGNERFTRKQAPATVPCNGISAAPSLIELYTSPVALFEFPS
jgi:hypothetical protein